MKQTKKEALECIRNNQSFNTGKIAYIANEDGSQGLMTKVDGQDVYTLNEKGEWVSI